MEGTKYKFVCHVIASPKDVLRMSSSLPHQGHLSMKLFSSISTTTNKVGAGATTAVNGYVILVIFYDPLVLFYLVACCSQSSSPLLPVLPRFEIFSLRLPERVKVLGCQGGSPIGLFVFFQRFIHMY